MGNAEEFSGRRSGLGRMWPAHRRPGSAAGGQGSSGQIRYAHGGAPPRVEPYCTVPKDRGPQGPAWHHGGDVGPAGSADAADVPGGGELDGGPWLTGAPVGGPHADLWVLVGGGIAAAAAFVAAFVASGGVASHPAAPGAQMPAVVSQACPSPAAGRTPKSLPATQIRAGISGWSLQPLPPTLSVS
jgi:hypothetical protein